MNLWLGSKQKEVSEAKKRQNGTFYNVAVICENQSTKQRNKNPTMPYIFINKNNNSFIDVRTNDELLIYTMLEFFFFCRSNHFYLLNIIILMIYEIILPSLHVEMLCVLFIIHISVRFAYELKTEHI